MKRQALFLVSVFLVLISTAFATVNTVSLTSPSNASWDTDGLVSFIFNTSGNLTGVNYSCGLWHNFSGSFVPTEVFNTSVANGTPTTFVVSGFTDSNPGYKWNVQCNSSDDNVNVFNSVNRTFYVDSVAPVFIASVPANKSWSKSSSMGGVVFGGTVSEVNNNTCVLKTNLDVLTNVTRSANNESAETAPYNNSAAFTFGFGSGSLFAENNTAAYLWNLHCTDLAGNIATWSVNNTFYVDRTAPSAFIFAGPANRTNSTDWTPNITWARTTELNFSGYYIRIDNDTTFLSPEFQDNITNRTLNYTNVFANLTGSKYYNMMVTSYDEAGNERNATTALVYGTQEACHTLQAGWNVCAIQRSSPVNASDLCIEIGTNCSYVAKYNSTHEFQTFTSGASTNGAMWFGSSALIPNESSTMFVYVSANTTWEGQSMSIRQDYLYFNLTNATTGWNLVPVLDPRGVTFQQLDKSINGNGTHVNLFNISNFFSYQNNTKPQGSKNTAFIRNWTLNNNTFVSYGETVWVNLNKSMTNYIWNASGEI